MTTVASSASATSPGAHRSRSRISAGGARLASGLVLFAYVLSHFLNHALGNVSLAAMEGALDAVAGFWSLLPLKLALYVAFAVHIALGLRALYERRPFRYRPGEALQLASGLLIPVLLIDHVVGTRVGAELYGFSGRYAPFLHNFYVVAPGSGVKQVVTLLVSWLHGCIGLYYWLRLKPFFTSLAPLLLGLAVLVPAVSLLGFLQGGREVARLAADPAWREANLTMQGPIPPDAFTTLGRISSVALWTYVALIAAVILARLARFVQGRRSGVVTLTYPDGRAVRVPRGTSVLEASRLNRIPHTAVCGGKGRCSTCRVRIVGAADGLPAPSQAERTVLERIGAGESVRLACQLRPAHDLTVAPLMPTDRPRMQALHQPSALGEERFVVAMFVDMRGSTGLAEHRLPFDTVFVINRFLEAVGGAVAASGGAPNQFLGDGMMALFGLESDREAAARQALAAIDRVAENVAALNAALAQHLDEPIRYGVGLHAGPAILGEIGDRRHGGAVFTAIGDAVNVASRLQGMTKALGVVALVSEAVFKVAGEESDWPRREIDIAGRTGSLWVRSPTEGVEDPPRHAKEAS
jgi:adenylate cyclase